MKYAQILLMYKMLSVAKSSTNLLSYIHFNYDSDSLYNPAVSSVLA